MGTILDLAAAFIIILLSSVFSPMVVINAQTTDADATRKLTNVLRQAVDTATSTSQTTGQTPGMLDNDGETIAITGGVITVYAGRPIGNATLTKPTTLFLPYILHDAATPSAQLNTTIFVAPSGSLQMQDGWSNGSAYSPAVGCPHGTLLVGTTATLSLDCTNGTISNSL